MAEKVRQTSLRNPVSAAEITAGKRNALGEGGYGRVFSAHIRGVMCAVKEFPSNSGAKHRNLESSNHEKAYRALKRLKKQHFIPVPIMTEPPYLVQELVGYNRPGAEVVSMGAVMHSSSPKLKKQVAKKVKEAFQWLGKAGIIHMDVSPSNVMVVFKGSKLLDLKVIDFGISRIIGRPVKNDNINLMHLNNVHITRNGVAYNPRANIIVRNPGGDHHLNEKLIDSNQANLLKAHRTEALMLQKFLLDNA